MRAKFPRQLLSTLLVCLICMGLQGCEQPNPASPSNDVTSHDPAPRSVQTTNNTTCDFSGSDMSGADLSGSNGSGCNFSNGHYTNASFINGRYTNASFINGRYTNASFAESDLAEADFRGAFLTGVDFTGANLQEAVLEGATGLTADQLCQASSLKEAQMDGQVLKLVCELCPALVGDACRE